MVNKPSKSGTEIRRLPLEGLNHEILTLEEELALGQRMRNGNPEDAQAARTTLIKHNLRLVVSIAKKNKGKGIDFEDLVQAGSIGLIKAVDRYDPERGLKFSTYATHQIRNSIGREINSMSRLIRISESALPALFGIKYSNNGPPKETEQDLVSLRKKYGHRPEVIRALLEARGRQVFSLSNSRSNYPNGDANGYGIPSESVRELGVEDGKSPLEQEELNHKIIGEILQAIRYLPISKRDIKIFFRHYGLNEDGLTEEAALKYKDIGRIFSISPSRAGQICCYIKRELSKNPSLRELLADIEN